MADIRLRSEDYDGDETELCLINKKNKDLLVVVVDDTDRDLVKVIATDGRILSLERKLFHPEPVELPVKSLNPEQQEKLRSINQQIETEALETVRKVGEIVMYETSRLTFLARIIEPLAPHESFSIICRDGHFTMTKTQFYSTFSNVANSVSYRLNGNYNYSTTPSKAYLYCKSRRRGE